jgi:hypothetical protein
LRTLEYTCMYKVQLVKRSSGWNRESNWPRTLD